MASPFRDSLTPDQLEVHDILCQSQYEAGHRAGSNAQYEAGITGKPVPARLGSHLAGLKEARARISKANTD